MINFFSIFNFFKNKDMDEERHKMVEEQLVSRGIMDPDIIKSMLIVPRHLFVKTKLRKYAYYDGPLNIGEGQTISQPFIVALMLEAIEPSSSDQVLEIGTGSGYAAAVLSRIVSEVYSIERIDSLAKEAILRFHDLKYDNVYIRIGDGTKGWPEKAPFDGIIVSAGAPAVPVSLLEQLKQGGRMVIPVGCEDYQDLILIRKESDGSFSRDNLGRVFFVPLISDEGLKQ